MMIDGWPVKVILKGDSTAAGALLPYAGNVAKQMNTCRIRNKTVKVQNATIQVRIDPPAKLFTISIEAESGSLHGIYATVATSESPCGFGKPWSVTNDGVKTPYNNGWGTAGIQQESNVDTTTLVALEPPYYGGTKYQCGFLPYDPKTGKFKYNVAYGEGVWSRWYPDKPRVYGGTVAVTKDLSLYADDEKKDKSKINVFSVLGTESAWMPQAFHTMDFPEILHDPQARMRLFASPSIEYRTGRPSAVFKNGMKIKFGVVDGEEELVKLDYFVGVGVMPETDRLIIVGIRTHPASDKFRGHYVLYYSDKPYKTINYGCDFNINNEVDGVGTAAGIYSPVTWYFNQSCTTAVGIRYKNKIRSGVLAKGEPYYIDSIEPEVVRLGFSGNAASAEVTVEECQGCKYQYDISTTTPDGSLPAGRDVIPLVGTTITRDKFISRDLRHELEDYVLAVGFVGDEEKRLTVSYKKTMHYENGESSTHLGCFLAMREPHIAMGSLLGWGTLSSKTYDDSETLVSIAYKINSNIVASYEYTEDSFGMDHSIVTTPLIGSCWGLNASDTKYTGASILDLARTLEQNCIAAGEQYAAQNNVPNPWFGPSNYRVEVANSPVGPWAPYSTPAVVRISNDFHTGTEFLGLTGFTPGWQTWFGPSQFGSGDGVKSGSDKTIDILGVDFVNERVYYYMLSSNYSWPSLPYEERLFGQLYDSSSGYIMSHGVYRNMEKLS